MMRVGAGPTNRRPGPNGLAGPHVHPEQSQRSNQRLAKNCECAHHLIEEQARQIPDAVAIHYGTERVTFGQLDTKANLLASRLIALGVGPEVLVALCAERSIEMVVGMLAILKAGGAYVPLDPSYPAERLAFMMEDSRVAVFLTQRSLLDLVKTKLAPTIYLDDPIAYDANHPAATSQVVGSSNPAYVIYTSGSTGRPKGVVVTHGGLANYLKWCQAAYPVTAGNATPVHSSVSFDLTVTSLWLPLVSGRQVRLVLNGIGIEPLVAALRSQSDCSLVKITPAHLRLLSQVLSPNEAAGRTRAFIIGGENLTFEDIAFWQRFAPDTLLVNEYGPTETVVGCCIYSVNSVKYGTGSVPIGRPISNTQLYVLDACMREVAQGEPGELFIGGAGVARGYLNRPRLTAERFVPDPFGPVSGARLYRTGDRVRLLEDGNLEFLGRIDNQVKIRGYRIELGEVESIILQHPSVSECAVVVRKDLAGENQLVAYAVPRDGAAINPSELREFVERHLPEHMVPSATVVVESMPLNVSGKVDRQALADRPMESHGDRPKFVAPRDTLEKQLVKMWEETLGIRPIGVTDSVFDLGVSSLLSVQLYSQIQRKFGRKDSLELLVKAPTIELLARRLRQDEPTSKLVSLVQLRTGKSEIPFFCVHGGGGTTFLLRHLASNMGPNRPVYGLQARAWDDSCRPDTSVEDMAANYVREIRTVQPKGPYLLGGYCFGGIVAFEMAQQLHDLGEEVALLVALNAPNPTNRDRLKNIGGRKESAITVSDVTNERDSSKSHRRGMIRKIQSGVGWRYRLWIARARWKLIAIRIRIRIALGRSLPTMLRFHHLMAISQRAEQGYVPRAASIPIAVFRSNLYYLDSYLGNDPDLGWGVLAKGNLEVHEITCRGPDRSNLLEDPCVHVVAQRLQERLDHAEAEHDRFCR